MFSRNIGLISDSQQQRLSDASVLVCGLGGMGGVCAEVLVRMGIGHLVLADHDRFELSNLNRQIHSNRDTIGHPKVQVLSEEFKKINPELKLDIHAEGVTAGNVSILLQGVDVVVNAMDKIRESLILERHARMMNKPIVDAWLTPYASVFVIKEDSPHWEEYLELPTRGVAIDSLTKELCQTAVQKEVSYTFSFGDPYRYIDSQTVKDVIQDRTPRPSLCPVVWLSGVLMANEVFKLIAGYPTTNHVGIIYDQYEHRLLLHGEADGRHANHQGS